MREPDGLAMSSRNSRLDCDQRARGGALFEALECAGDLAYEGERSAERLVQAAHETMTAREVEPEYVGSSDPLTFDLVHALDAPALLVIAARIGETRLIDNFLLDPTLAGATSSNTTPASLAN